MISEIQHSGVHKEIISVITA